MVIGTNALYGMPTDSPARLTMVTNPSVRLAVAGPRMIHLNSRALTTRSDQ